MTALGILVFVALCFYLVGCSLDRVDETDYSDPFYDESGWGPLS